MVRRRCQITQSIGVTSCPGCVAICEGPGDINGKQLLLQPWEALRSPTLRGWNGFCEFRGFHERHKSGSPKAKATSNAIPGPVWLQERQENIVILERQDNVAGDTSVSRRQVRTAPRMFLWLRI